GNEVMTQERLRLTWFRRRFAGARGDEQLKHLFTIFYHNSQTNCICLMGSLLPEFATFEDTMKESVKELCKEIVDWLTDCLERAREAGRLSFDGAAADRALLVLSILMSSLLMSRVLGKKVFVRMADQLLQDLGADWRVADLPEESDRQKMPPFSYTDHS
ncbi:MAG TPA: hypothetical protein VG605_05950, partial [Puia sp.]|nr:hypothetical protein [Puia sp.]